MLGLLFYFSFVAAVAVLASIFWHLGKDLYGLAKRGIRHLASR